MIQSATPYLAGRRRRGVQYPSAAAAVIGTNYAATVLTDTPALFWPMQDANGAGSVADTSGNARNGTPGAGVTLGTTAGPFTNTKSATFSNAANSVITSSYNPFAGDFTVEGWTNRTTSSDADNLFGASAVAGPFLKFESGAQSVTFDNDGTSGAGGVTWATVWPGNSQWGYWAMTFNSSTFIAELFINGVSQGTKASAAIGSPPGNFQAGLRGASSEPLNGSEAYVAVYASILGSARISAHYTAGTT